MEHFVSIITVNYNGKKYLKRFFDSVFALDYPEDKYEVLMVDNGSVDDSISFAEKNYPMVKVIKSCKNLGFAAGNNLGMKSTNANLCFLVNNDTVLEKKSLKNIIDTYTRWSKKTKVGAVNAKMILIDSYLPFEIQDARFTDYKLPSNAQPVNKHIFAIPHEGAKLFSEKVLLPLSNKQLKRLNILINVRQISREGFKISLNNRVIYRGNFNNSLQVKQVKLSLDEKQINLYKVNLVQNAGNFYFRDGHGRDRGAIVIKNQQYYEEDYGQYNKEESIPGFCGAGVLLDHKVLEDVGYFDEDFFMYYEDGEMSFRFKEHGYKILYSPSSVIRHIHAGSSSEWSEFFIHHAERGRLLLVAKHWPRVAAIKEWAKYVINDTLGVPFYYILKGAKRRALSLFMTRIKANISIIKPFFRGLTRTKRLNSNIVKNFL